MMWLAAYRSVRLCSSDVAVTAASSALAVLVKHAAGAGGPLVGAAGAFARRALSFAMSFDAATMLVGACFRSWGAR